MLLYSTVITVSCCNAGIGDVVGGKYKTTKLIIKKLSFCINVCLFVRVNDAGLWTFSTQFWPSLWPCDSTAPWRFLSGRLSTTIVSSPKHLSSMIPHRFHSRLQHTQCCVLLQCLLCITSRHPVLSIEVCCKHPSDTYAYVLCRMWHLFFSRKYANYKQISFLMVRCG